MLWYLFVESVPLLNDEGAVDREGHTSDGGERHRKHQEHHRLRDLCVTEG